MEGKESVLNLLGNNFVALTPVMKKLGIQYYQAKLIITQLIEEGKVEAKQFGKRMKYRKAMPLEGAETAQDEPNVPNPTRELVGG